MALQTGITAIDIIPYFTMVIIGFGLLVTGQACKHSVVTGILMAFGTTVPNLTVLAAVNWEVLPVVIESCRCPSGISSMAGRTICWKMCSSVIRVICLVKVSLMTRHAFRIRVSIAIACMTLFAILDVVAQCQGEEVMVNLSGTPTRISGVTGRTIGRIAHALVIRVLRASIVGLMAADAVRRGIGVIIGGVTLFAVLDIVA